MSRLSVVIPTCCTADRHGTSRLRLTLTGYTRQSLPPDAFEVIVVDDGSEPALAPQVEDWRLPHPVSVVRRERDGIASAYNAGIAAARSPVVLLGIDDEVPSPETLAAHLAVHERPGAWVGFGRTMFAAHTTLFRDVITGELAPDALDPRTYADGGWLPGAAQALGLAGKPISPTDVATNFDKLVAFAATPPMFDDVERVLATGSGHRLRIGWLTMRVGNHSVPTGLLRELGGFDEVLDRHGGWYTDLDLGLRLQAAGASFALAGDALTVNLTHRRHRTEAQMASGLAYLFAKHRRMDVALCPMYFDRQMRLVDYARALAAAAPWWPASVPAAPVPASAPADGPEAAARHDGVAAGARGRP